MGKNYYENFGLSGAWLVLRTHEVYHRTASVLFENEYARAKRKYVNLWVEIEEILIPKF